MTRVQTLWSQHASPDRRMLDYTVGDDRQTDMRLLHWDVIGSLGHVEALARGKLITPRERGRMRRALRAALQAIDAGTLRIDARHEDGHSAIEFWLTRHWGDVGERIHLGRSRNDQVSVDIRLALKHDVLRVHQQILDLVGVLLRFATVHRRAVWPGYTHQRIAMPSSAGLWASGLAEGLLDAADGVAGFWNALDRSPLGSAAGYGAPLPLVREAAARALGFGGVDQAVTSTQGSRGQLESHALFWCATIAQQCAKLSADVILFSADEFGWLRLPDAWSTGSSIMPQKRNPDLFELTRGRAALVDGDLATVLALRARLPSGYHRDFQLLKAPLWHGVDATSAMLEVLAAALPDLVVDAARGRTALRNEVFATDEATRRAAAGVPFRQAYRDVAAALQRGEAMPELTSAMLRAHRQSTGGMGNLPLAALRLRITAAQQWNRRERQRFERALARLLRGAR